MSHFHVGIMLYLVRSAISSQRIILECFLFYFTKVIKQQCFSSFLNFVILSIVLIFSGNTFQYLLPLYSNILLPYLVLKFGVSSWLEEPLRRLLILKCNLRVVHCPWSILNTIIKILYTTRDSIGNQCNSFNLSIAEL